ncbi:ABC transporter permease [Marinobacter sp.]|mgnify:CR=1 FL=1|jgi:NitT/TauT family transport system permease protein|uniref:ABC transporter permease n=1 Tax=Marinobacter sp. TaxID=50741 RepID=UPI000C595F74|nr:ABC transporter permease [Marinobacter sp.]MAK49218.1 nitrate ABC transporter permease [Marinobacter sp.]MAO28504.1 nitrate ABC transporter permease [Roseovarius sp.]MTI78694.1 ABC transporter permease [Marinobacter sp.]|tara:strand:+ start:232 stop:1026 length:795 start_codon:yes stop_codon:yes gene_type:complete
MNTKNFGWERSAPWVVGVSFFALIIILWEAAGHNDSAVTTVMPPPSEFLAMVIESDFRVGLGSQAASLDEAVLATFGRVFAGMGLAFVAALITGTLIGLSRYATWCISPVLYVLAPIAPIAWIPLAIVVFGINNATAVFIVFMGVYFILTIGTLAEIRRVPEEYLTVSGNLGASKWQRWVWVILPSILPGVFTLLRTNFIAAWMAVLVAEMVGMRDGLGAIIMMGRNLFNNELIMFGMLIIGVSGFVVDRILAFIGQRILWWRV